MARPGKTVLVERDCSMNALSGPATRYLQYGTLTPIASGGNMAPGSFTLEPDDYIGTKLRLRVTVFINATAPTADITISMFPVTAPAGGVGVTTVTIGTVVTGSALVFTAPALSTITRSETAEFDWPTAGQYIIGVTLSASMTANSNAVVITELEAR